MFIGEARAYYRVDHLKLLHSGRLQPYPANIRVVWKGLSGINTPAYYKNPLIRAVKSFIVQAPII
jgi:hypothetical protein